MTAATISSWSPASCDCTTSHPIQASAPSRIGAPAGPGVQPTPLNLSAFSAPEIAKSLAESFLLLGDDVHTELSERCYPGPRRRRLSGRERDQRWI